MAAVLVALLLALAAPAPGKTIRQIELRGNSRILAIDTPVRRGRLYLFHRYPDGVYMSVPAEDVLGIAATRVESAPPPPDTVVLGPTGEGIPTNNASAPPAPSAQNYYDQGYPGYYGYGYWPCLGCNGPPLPPRPDPAPPALVGPNGFPLMPGSPPPLPIGPNGFPILNSPPPPVAQPRH